MANDFKPNIYPMMYWGLLYGLAAAFLLFIVFLFSKYLTLVWFPVFLTGVIWGGYRNYKKQKEEGVGSTVKKTPMEEFKDAARDIIGATKEVIADQVKDSVEKEEAEQAASEATENNESEVGEEAIPQRAVTLEEVSHPEETAASSEPTEEKKPEAFGRPGPPPPATQ